MKKHISIIRLDPELETGLIAHLQHAHPDSPAARTLAADLQELLRGTCLLYTSPSPRDS